MTIWFDVDTALSEVPINLMPLLDDADFKSKEESVTYNQAGLDLVWNFITTAGALTQTEVTPTDTGGNYDFVNQGNGHYSIEIPASGGASINNNTEGFGWFTGVATGILPWRSPMFGFRAAGLNDKLVDSAYSATRGLAGTALPDAAADAAGGLPISDDGGLDMDAIGGASAADVADAVWDEALSGHSGVGSAGAALTAAGSAGDPWSTALPGSYGTGTAGKMLSDAKTTVDNTYADMATPGDVADAVWDEAISGHTTATTFGGKNQKVVPSETINDYKADVSGLATSTEVNAIALLDEVVIGTYTVQDILTILAAKTVGKATGGGTTTITYRGVDDTSNVVVETVDANGNRSAVTLTV